MEYLTNKRDVAITNLNEWNISIQNNIRYLNKCSIFFKVINIILVVIVTFSTSILGSLESISLFSEISNEETDWAYIISIIKLILIANNAVCAALVVSISPDKIGNGCKKAIQEYYTLSRIIQSKINKYELENLTDEEIITSYIKFKNKYLEIEINIIKNTPLISPNN